LKSMKFPSLKTKTSSGGGKSHEADAAKVGESVANNAQVEKEKPFEFPVEDENTARERFERQMPCDPARAILEFYEFLWKQNANMGLASMTEIVKDSSSGKMEKGMKRRVAGYEEEVVLVVPDKMIEYVVIEGTGPGVTPNNKGRITFRPGPEPNTTMVVWTIFWSPSSIVASLVYKVMIKGYCNLALYQMERKIATGVAQPIEEKPSSAGDGSEDDDLSAGVLAEGEVPKLQFAARLQTGYEGNLTAQQAASLEKLREKCKTAGEDVWELVRSHPDGADRVMLRFLRAECSGRARDFHVDKSYARMIETLRWRREMGADEFAKGKTPAHFEKFREMGGEIDVVDREGRVVVFTRAGLLSVSLDVKAFTEHQWHEGLCCITERRMQTLRESSKRLGHEVSATVVVYDLKGAGIASRKIIPFARIINEVASKHYPEMVDVIMLINAPSIFSTLWSAIKGMLDKVTESKVKVFGSSKSQKEKVEKYLRSFIDPRLIPKEYGGDSDVVVPIPLNAREMGLKA